MSKQFFIIKNEASDDAIIDIDGYIGEKWWKEEDKQNSLERIKKELNKLKASKAKTITVNIHSLGGDVDHALAIHDALVDHPAKIITFISGMCASAATIIFVAGDERKMSDNALFLIHKSSSIVWGNENDLQEGLDAQKAVNERMVNIYLKVSSKAKEEIETLMSVNNGKGKWITAEEAKDFGFITDITNQKRKAACINKHALLDHNLPGLPEGYEFFFEEDKDNTWNKITAFIEDKFKNFSAKNNNDSKNINNQLEMKNQFPLIFALLACAEDKPFDKEKGEILTEEQLNKIEAELKKISDLQTKVDSLTADNDAKKIKINELQALVDKFPKSITAQSGADHDPNSQVSVEEYMANSDFYAENLMAVGKDVKLLKSN